jgi:hypothetical protein
MQAVTQLRSALLLILFSLFGVGCASRSPHAELHQGSQLMRAQDSIRGSLWLDVPHRPGDAFMGHDLATASGFVIRWEETVSYRRGSGSRGTTDRMSIQISGPARVGSWDFSSEEAMLIYTAGRTRKGEAVDCVGRAKSGSVEVVSLDDRTADVSVNAELEFRQGAGQRPMCVGGLFRVSFAAVVRPTAGDQ